MEHQNTHTHITRTQHVARSIVQEFFNRMISVIHDAHTVNGIMTRMI